MKKELAYLASFLALCALVAGCVLPVFAPPNDPKPHPLKGSGKVTFYADDVKFGANATVQFKIIDDNMHPDGDQISFKYTDNLGRSFTLGLPTGIYEWEGNLLASVTSWQTVGVMTATGKITSSSNTSWLALGTLILFTIYDSGQKVPDQDYVQLFVGMPYQSFPWDPISPSGYPPTPNWHVTSGNLAINWPTV